MLTVDFKIGRKEYRVHGARQVEYGESHLFIYMSDKSGAPEGLYLVKNAKVVRVLSSEFNFEFTRKETLLVLK